MPKEIRLYLCRDEKSGAMLEAFRRELSRIPKDERPKVHVKFLRLRDPSRFEAFLQELEELFGGIYVQEFKKYDIRAVPAVVVDGEKVAEGRYLSEDEIRSLLGTAPPPAPRPPPALVQPARARAAPQAQAPIELAPVELAPVEEQPKPPREPKVELPPVELEPEAPLMLEEPAPPKPPEAPRPVQPPRQTLAPLPDARQPATTRPEPPVVRPPTPAPAPQPRPAPPRAEAAPVAAPPAAEGVRPAGPASRFSCYNCVYFDSSRNRCRLLHVAVQNPENPPCGRGRR
uniref:Thioredoxin family protein n=1 Tax=Thermofilum pendens TaxID=2269 RepID=A0A7C3WPQ2_THEPE